MDGVNEVTIEDMEALICQLPTVLKCAVSVNDWGAVEEIHVLTSLERTPKQIVRDVESALLAQWNLRIDHKRISVAQITTEGIAESSTVAPARLRVQEYHLDADSINQQAYTRVVFTWGATEAGALVRGEWSGRCLPSQYGQAMAWATVDALNKIPGLEAPLVLSDLRNVTIANRPVMVAALSQLDHRRREKVLIGTAEIQGDMQGATVRAILDAVNRRVSMALEEGGA